MSFRIGAGTGFAGDRFEPAEILARRGELDALVFECLAERTIALAVSDASNGEDGFDARILRRLRGTLPWLRPGTLVLTNAGAANPLACARTVHSLAQELGLERTVAAVTGDDVLAQLDSSSRIIGTDRVLADFSDRIVSANAYLGSEGPLMALEQGATVVVTGRVGDASLFVAPMRRAFGWRSDDLAPLAEATLVGHLLECAGQLSGGYFADGGRKSVPDLARVGFPFADVTEGGSAVYGKVDGTGGRIDRRTVLEQLLYEIDDPHAYLTPDVTVDVSGVTVQEHPSDRVAVFGARPVGAPEQLKVSVGVRDGLVATAEISYMGRGSLGRARLAEQIVRERWTDVLGWSATIRGSIIGVDAARPWWGDRSEADPDEVRLRLSVRTFDRREAAALLDEVEALYTNGPYGGGGVSTALRETVGIVSTLIDREAVRPIATVIR